MISENQSLSLPVKPLLIVLSGLSGSGKDSVLEGLRESGFPLEFIITVTTRPRRANEQDGIHYNFTSAAAFQELIDTDMLLEWASVYGNFYGVPRESVRQAIAGGRDVIIKTDVQGAATIKKKVPQALCVFLTVPSLEDLATRLKQRRTETAEGCELRLKTARAELASLPIFDYLVINQYGELDRAVADILSIIRAEKCRVVTREINL